jgi:hypothetical protein
LSGYDCEAYKPLAENGWTQCDFNVNTTTGARKPKSKTESLWRNYDLVGSEEKEVVFEL